MRKKTSIVAAMLLLAGCGGQVSPTAASPSPSSAANETKIDLSTQQQQVVISQAGTYRLSGTTEKGVLVNAESGTVQLILDGATIANSDSAGLAITGGEKAIVTLAAGTENIISDGGSDETYDAAVYSTVPLVFEGEGSLTVLGRNQEGISTESTDMTFNGGSYTVTSADDGIGAGGDGGTLTFNGGTFHINASGDGIDSNGDIVFNGGTIYVVGSSAGGDAGIDADSGFTINGGDIIALGTDMLETPTEVSKQNTLALTFDETYKEGSKVSVVKEDGTVIVTVSADQDFRTLLVSNAQLTEGETYHVQIDGETISINGETDFVLTDIITSYGMGKQAGGPTDHPQGPDERPDGEPPARRE